MAKQRTEHYSIDEMTNIIISCHSSIDSRCANEIARQLDTFTFSMLDNIVLAIKKIAKGRK